MGPTGLQAITAAIILAILLAHTGPSVAQDFGCTPPMPNDPRDVQACADPIRSDFGTYIADVEGYMSCLDVERTRAFEEGHAIIQEHGRLQRPAERLEATGPTG